MLQVVLLDVLGEIVHLKVKDNSSKTVLLFILAFCH